MHPSAHFSRLCTILQDLKCSHLGRPCILSSVVCFTAEVLSIPQFQFFRLNTNVLLPGPPQTVFYPASVALLLRYIYIYIYNGSWVGALAPALGWSWRGSNGRSPSEEGSLRGGSSTKSCSLVVPPARERLPDGV